MNIKTTLTAFVILLLTSQSLWADVRASLSRQTVYEGDSVSLNIVTNESGKDADPDLSVLQQDFDILGTASSQQTSIINGKRSQTRQWRVELVPKHSGELTVPPVKVGADVTQALTLQVTAQPDAMVAEAGQPVYIRTQLQPQNSPVYVQQQLRYTLQLFYREQLFEGSLDGPHVEHALVERLGDDLQFQTTVNGMEYQVIERHFAIFPEQSGTFTLSPVTFNGRLAGQSQQQRMPSMFKDDMLERFFGNTSVTMPGKRIRLRSEGYTLDVQPRAAAFTGDDWLPSEQLTLTDSWSSDPPEFRSGVPVTRTLTLEARGLESTHLPEFTLPESDGMRLYPEQPVYNNRTDREWVIGTRQLTVAYVPSATGMQTIPAMKIDWWDTTAEQQKTVELPAWTVNVLPGAGVTDAQAPPRVAPAVVEQQQAATAIAAADETGSRDWLAAIKSRGPWMLAGMLLLAALLFVLRRINPRQAPTPTRTAGTPARQQLKAARSAVQQACQANDPAAAAKALLQWAAASRPADPPRNLGALMQVLSAGVNEIEALERALYSAAAETWQGEALWRVFDQGLDFQPETRLAAKAGLSPLYPDWKT